MIECAICGEKVDEDVVFYECPYCDETIYGDGVWQCEYCGTYIDIDGEEFQCPECDNSGISETENGDDSVEVIFVETCPECGSTDYDGYCYECGYPNNQGWIGENY